MKTYEGVIRETAGNRIILTETGSGETLSLKAGEATLTQARAMVGRRVRFQAQLHESSIFLAAPIFIVGSQYGLQAVREETRESGVRMSCDNVDFKARRVLPSRGV
jgi:hypothetical protein